MPLSAETPAPVSTVMRERGSARSAATRGEYMSGGGDSGRAGRPLAAAAPAGAELPFHFLPAGAAPRRRGFAAARKGRCDDLFRQRGALVAHPDLGPALIGRQYAHGGAEVLVADETVDAGLLEETPHVAGHERIGRGEDAAHRSAGKGRQARPGVPVSHGLQPAATMLKFAAPVSWKPVCP